VSPSDGRDPGDDADDGIITGRGFDRLINFPDAVVAIAVTILALPLSSLTKLPEGGTVWTLIDEQSGPVTSFLFTFVVIAMMWGVHNRVVNRMRGYDGTIFWLNIAWIASIAFMTWPAALYGETMGFAATPAEYSGGEGLGGVGLFYWLTLALVSVLGSLLARHVRRRPALLEPRYRSQEPEGWRARWRGPAFAGSSVLIGVVSLFAPVAASWLPLGLIPVSAVFRPQRTEMADPGPSGQGFDHPDRSRGLTAPD